MVFSSREHAGQSYAATRPEPSSIRSTAPALPLRVLLTKVDERGMSSRRHGAAQFDRDHVPAVERSSWNLPSATSAALPVGPGNDADVTFSFAPTERSNSVLRTRSSWIAAQGSLADLSRKIVPPSAERTFPSCSWPRREGAPHGPKSSDRAAIPGWRAIHLMRACRAGARLDARAISSFHAGLPVRARSLRLATRSARDVSSITASVTTP